jgi:hypothetical protein
MGYKKGVSPHCFGLGHVEMILYGDIHVFRPPPMVSYFPLCWYPFEIIGGMLQQASLWPSMDSIFCLIDRLSLRFFFLK